MSSSSSTDTADTADTARARYRARMAEHHAIEEARALGRPLPPRHEQTKLRIALDVAWRLMTAEEQAEALAEAINTTPLPVLARCMGGR